MTDSMPPPDEQGWGYFLPPFAGGLRGGERLIDGLARYFESSRLHFRQSLQLMSSAQPGVPQDVDDRRPLGGVKLKTDADSGEAHGHH
jgi:hypothetical protein